MVVAKYYGGDRENSLIDYTLWYEWMMAIKDDFRRFIDYRLSDIPHSENLIKELKKASKNLLNTCPLGLTYLREFNIDKGDKYTIVEYPVFDKRLNRYNCSYVIISCDYKEFIFIDSENSAPSVKVYKVDGIVEEERIIPGIDLEWSECLINHNLDYLRGKSDSIKELGGFAEEPTDVDGDYESFNFCLAEDYASSMVREDFESLGYIDYSLIDNITYWLNYDSKIGAKDADFISKIPSGEFVTSFGRTFGDAVSDRRLGEFAVKLIYNGNKNPRVYFTAIAYSNVNFNVLNEIFEYISNPQEYVQFVNELMQIINQEYTRKEKAEKTEFIEQIKKYLRKMVAAQNKNFLENKNNYVWFNEVFGIKDKERKLSDS